ncbi:MAG: toxin-antitoxin system TumE family protein [Thermodesulfobacteriota bacterium]
MKVVELIRQRIVYDGNKFAELILWHLEKPLAASRHPFKYRLAYVVNGICVLRYDNEGGKGDHRHWGDNEAGYKFTTPQKLLADFQHDIERWNHENCDS